MGLNLKYSDLLQEEEHGDAELKTFSFPHFLMTLNNTIRSSQSSLHLRDIALLEFAAKLPNDSVSNPDVSFSRKNELYTSLLVVVKIMHC